MPGCFSEIITIIEVLQALSLLMVINILYSFLSFISWSVEHKTRSEDESSGQRWRREEPKGKLTTAPPPRPSLVPIVVI